MTSSWTYCCRQSQGEGLPFAEERRLFYVPMTRSRTGTYVVTDALRPSAFALELRRESNFVRQIGDRARKFSRCPSGSHLPSQNRVYPNCSNYPHCRHLSPRCPGCQQSFVTYDPPTDAVSCRTWRLNILEQ